METTQPDPNTTSLEPHLKEIYLKVKESVDSKAQKYVEKLESKKNDFQKYVFKDLFELDNMMNEIQKLEAKVKQGESSSIDEKKQLMKDSANLRQKIDRLTTKFEQVEKLPESIEKKKLCEILGMKGDEFKIGFTEEDVAVNEEYPAHVIISDICRLCKGKLKWTGSYSNHNQKCSFSDPCNSHFRYGCDKCLMKYCTNCAYPPNPKICGCGKDMVHTYVSYHSCDLCRASLNEECWRCSSCDFDLCDRCFDKIKQEEDNNEKDEKEDDKDKDKDKGEDKEKKSDS
eukprot:CAMPEP_0170519942 /NCGR_PEP_ID=MMETSP0209-20121228/5165_1 /TAXON_ID=665100 ORGANISM="Litonotus pictus, Strain P1" /NCGR_SAMPLE_ID=MMETSP0209 /ASSEMBLY_ACC=CAM_ASM_000301 /LENGTH=285 /DNA_ID=CAMNT_0010805943 /DNA_START=1 /DNA_END=858 /DNA_ORIENTATION=+